MTELPLDLSQIEIPQVDLVSPFSNIQKSQEDNIRFLLANEKYRPFAYIVIGLGAYWAVKNITSLAIMGIATYALRASAEGKLSLK
jgi:hypothetical protein